MSLGELPDLRGLADDDLLALVDTLPEHVLRSLADELGRDEAAQPDNPVEQAQELDEGYRSRDHLDYLSERLAAAVADVEAGQSRLVRVSMPPRSGKSLLSSVYLPIWLLRRHPDWKIGLISHSPTLAVSWGRTVRRTIEEYGRVLDLELAKDAGAAGEWQTTKRGGIVSRSAPGQSITGLGFKVLLIDDAVKDFAAAHSEVQRNALWEWWQANAYTRLEPPSLVIVVGTRWHEDDLLGRLASSEHEGDPADWEVIEFPAIAETNDVLGREPGEPLLSPLLDESPEEAVERWASIKANVGTYAWNALYQQRPSSPKGTIFDVDWWRYWTHDEHKATPDGRVIHVTPEQVIRSRLLDSWDCAFKGGDKADFVVGQRWSQMDNKRLLIAQVRDRMTFTETLARMKAWSDIDRAEVPFTAHVHERLVEDKANGTAIIDTLKEQITGLIPINPTESKEARARAVTPEVEAGNVYLPLPSDDGNEWVSELLDELRNFPTAAHDDQVDALTQALSRMRVQRKGSVTVPGRVTSLPGARRGQTALQMPSRRYGTR